MRPVGPPRNRLWRRARLPIARNACAVAEEPGVTRVYVPTSPPQLASSCARLADCARRRVHPVDQVSTAPSPQNRSRAYAGKHRSAPASHVTSHHQSCAIPAVSLTPRHRLLSMDQPRRCRRVIIQVGPGCCASNIITSCRPRAVSRFDHRSSPSRLRLPLLSPSPPVLSLLVCARRQPGIWHGCHPGCRAARELVSQARGLVADHTAASFVVFAYPRG